MTFAELLVYLAPAGVTGAFVYWVVTRVMRH